MDPTIKNNNPGTQDSQKTAPEQPVAAKARRDPLWPVLLIILGLLGTLAWIGFLGWAVFRMIGAWHGL